MNIILSLFRRMQLAKYWRLIFSLLLYLPIQNLYGQDTILVYNNYKYKLGFKLIEDATWDDSRFVDYLPVQSCGFQLYKKIDVPSFGLETGLYWINKGNIYSFYLIGVNNIAKFYYHNLSIPMCIRVDTRTIYASAGAYADLLLYRSRGHFNNHSTDSVGTSFPDRKFNLGVMATIGIEKEINKTLTFFAECRILSNVTSSKTELFHYSKNQIEVRPFFGDGYVNIGGSIGVNYKFLFNK